MNVDALLVKAQGSEPDGSARPRRWARLWPVYEALRERGFSCQRAVRWLAGEGAVPAGDERRALNAFHVLAARRRGRRRARPGAQATAPETGNLKPES